MKANRLEPQSVENRAVGFSMSNQRNIDYEARLVEEATNIEFYNVVTNQHDELSGRELDRHGNPIGNEVLALDKTLLLVCVRTS